MFDTFNVPFQTLNEATALSEAQIRALVLTRSYCRLIEPASRRNPRQAKLVAESAMWASGTWLALSRMAALLICFDGSWRFDQAMETSAAETFWRVCARRSSIAPARSCASIWTRRTRSRGP